MYMKKLFTTIIVLLLTVSVNVYAEDYNILVDENNNFTLKDSSNNPVTDNNIAKYENNTLTLGENTTFNEIKVKHNLTITSNDKEVSIKTLTTKEGNNYIASNINLNKLKVKDDDTYIFKMDIGGNLIVNNSELYSKDSWNEIRGFSSFTDSKVIANGSISMYGVNEEEYGYIIINSTVTSGGQIYTSNGGSFIKNSKVESSPLYSNGYFYIEESDILCNYFTQQNSASKTYIKNSTIKVKGAEYYSGQVYFSYPRDGIYLYDSLTLENSEFEAGSLYISNGGMVVKDSTIKLIKATEFNSSGNASIYGGLDSKNSKLLLDGELTFSPEIDSFQSNIEDSEIDVEDFYMYNYQDLKTYIKKSIITTHGKYSSVIHGEITFDSCKLNIINGINAYNNFSIINSTGVIKGMIDAKENMEVKDSIIAFSNETEFIQYAPLSIKHDLIINNSNIVFDNKKNSNKAVYIQGDVILDDKIIPIDQEKTKLKLIKLEDDTEARTTCRNCYDEDRPIYIYAYEDNTFSDYVKLATTKTISFRVRNGTWLDGTKDDINLDYFYGEKIEVDSLPEEVKKLLTSKMGEWSVDLNNIDPTKDQEIEFKYNIINPETATNFILLTIVVSLAIITIYKTRKKDFIKQ